MVPFVISLGPSMCIPIEPLSARTVPPSSVNPPFAAMVILPLRLFMEKVWIDVDSEKTLMSWFVVKFPIRLMLLLLLRPMLLLFQKRQPIFLGSY